MYLVDIFNESKENNLIITILKCLYTNLCFALKKVGF